MDPMNRLLWWRETHRDTYDRAHQFHGWHELITRHLCGRAVSDHGIAGKFFAYDLASRGWSPSLLDTWEIDARLLPEIEPFGTAAGVIDPAVANGLSLPAGTVVGTGGFDTSCAALGSGAAVPGVIGLVVGSWESLVAPIDAPLSARDVIDGRLAIGPHAGPSGLGVFALSPNGTVAVDRIRDLTSLSIIELTALLEASGPAPSPVLAIPHLSGAEGTLLGISLATTRADVAKAMMEGIAFDLALTIDRLRSAGAAAARDPCDRRRVTLELVDAAQGGPDRRPVRGRRPARGRRARRGHRRGSRRRHLPGTGTGPRRTRPPHPRVRAGCRPARPLRRAARALPDRRSRR